MKVVDVKEPVRLSLGKCFELVLGGLRFRLFRAAITVTIIALAAAFLTAMFTESLAGRKVAAAIDQQTWPRDQFDMLRDRISLPLTDKSLSEDLAQGGSHAAQNAASRQERIAEFQAWGGLSAEQMGQLEAVATRQSVFLAFFDGLDEGDRRAMVGPAIGIDIFRSLQDPQAFQQFLQRLAELGIRGKFPADDEDFRKFLALWQETEPLRLRIRQGHDQAVEQLRKDALKDREARAWLASADRDLRPTLLRYGFHPSAQTLDSVRRQAALSLNLDQMLQAFSDARVKRGLEDRVNRKLTDLTDSMFLREVSTSSGAKWLVELAAQSKLPLNLTASRAQEVARWRMQEDNLAAVESIVDEVAGQVGLLGFSQRTLWLLLVSFLVCIVGIANAMLMSVTERFREIATMKCLGATDGFIMVNFIMESCMQGVAGGVIGAALGLVLGTLRSCWKYGWMSMQHYPTTEVLTAGAIAIGVGILVSAMAAVYPAWVAARLAPMEAMRIE